jgi:hypothetical protein
MTDQGGGAGDKKHSNAPPILNKLKTCQGKWPRRKSMDTFSKYIYMRIVNASVYPGHT